MEVRKPSTWRRLLRLFCGKTGLAAALAMISAWSFVGIIVAGIGTWTLSELWADWKLMREAIIRVDKSQGRVEERTDNSAKAVARLEVDIRQVQTTLTEHDRRLLRIELRP